MLQRVVTQRAWTELLTLLRRQAGKTVGALTAVMAMPPVELTMLRALTVMTPLALTVTRILRVIRLPVSAKGEGRENLQPDTSSRVRRGLVADGKASMIPKLPISISSPLSRARPSPRSWASSKP